MWYRGEPAAVQRRASAAPLAGVWRVEDVGERQLPGKVRAADLWNTRNAGRRGRLEVEGFRVGIGRSALPGESRPAHRPRQRRPLHALVRWPSAFYRLMSSLKQSCELQVH